MKYDGLVIDNNITRIEEWRDVPTYEKLNVSYCAKLFLSCLIGSHEAYKYLEDYLLWRKENNNKYKEFWENESKITFNHDKTRYLTMCLKRIE